MTNRAASAESSGVFAGYMAESSRPLASLVFVAPMLLAYELGLVMLGPSGLRNGADAWLRTLLDRLGFTHYFLLPLLTCSILLGWHHVERQRWSVGLIVLYGMLLESLGLGCVLMLVAQIQGSFLAVESARPLIVFGGGSDVTSQVLAFLGAGIYEEMLFRLMLVPAFAAVCKFAGASRGVSLTCAVLGASVLFAVAHYQLDLAAGSWRFTIEVGDTFSWMSFLFRATAGVFFSVLFLYRGFGIAAGTHALYDILAALA